LAVRAYVAQARRADGDARALRTDLVLEAPRLDSVGAADQERVDALVEQARDARAQIAGEDAGASFIADADTSNALTKLARYESEAERSLFRALQELERRQVRRKQRSSPLPRIRDAEVVHRDLDDSDDDTATVAPMPS